MSVTNTNYSYLDEAYPGANSFPQYQPKPVAPSGAEGDVAATEEKDMALFSEDGFGFDDFLDIINPLQHIPFISTLYREMTGDEISPGSRVIGGGIFGGGIGLAVSVVNAAIEAGTGKDVGGHIASLFKGDDGVTDETSVIASASETIPAQTTGQQNAAVNGFQNVITQENQPRVITAAFDSRGQNIPGTAEMASGAKPQLYMGLEWKGKTPDLQSNIENAKALQGNDLTPDQLSQVLASFRMAKGSNPLLSPVKTENVAVPKAANPVQDAASAYEKYPRVTTKPAPLVSGNFDYLDKMV